MTRPVLLHVTTVPITMMFNVGQARYFAERGWEVHAASAPGPLLDQFAAQTGARIHPLPMTRQMRPARDARALAAMLGVMRSVRPDVVHAQSPKGALIGLTAARLLGVPARFYGVLGMPVDTAQGLARRLLIAADRVACASAHRALCVSQSVREALLRLALCPPERAIVLGDGSVGGIDARGVFAPEHADGAAFRRRLGIPASAPVVGFVGRLEREKGVAELWTAFKRLRTELPDAHLVVIGNSEAKDMVSAELLQELSSDPQSHWVREYVTDADLAAAYAAMSVVALPSYREGFPSVLLEAAAMARPAVAARVPGCTDAILDGETGTLVPVRDAGALAEALAAYLRDPARAAAHGARARARALAAYAPERIWEATHREYDRVLGAGGAARAA